MVAFRSRRLEQIFGAPFDTVTYDGVLSLIPSVAESDDLDFKLTLYGDTEGARKECGTDVAAMSNARGGLIVQGIGEDEQGRAATAPGVAIVDKEITRLRQIVATWVQPLPEFDVIPVEDPNNPGHGFLLIAVPQSVRRPHAIYRDGSYRFPRRHGTTTRYLSPVEIAEQYRAQFAGLQGRADEGARIERELITRLDRSQTFLVVSLVPDRPGESVIDTHGFRQFEREVLTTNPYLFLGPRSFQRASLRSRRLTAFGTGNNPLVYSRLGCELHDDGRGTFATILDPRNGPKGEQASDQSVIDDETVVHSIASALHFLGRHASDRAATGGLASIRVTIAPVRSDLPAVLTHSRGGWGGDQVGRRQADDPPVAEAIADIDDLAEANTELVATTYRLASSIFQEFAHTEAAQLTANGAIRIRYWRHESQDAIRSWASKHGVTISEDELPD